MTGHWSENHEAGGRFVIRLLVDLGLRIGRRCTRALLHLATPFFVLRRVDERRASLPRSTPLAQKPAVAG